MLLWLQWKFDFYPQITIQQKVFPKNIFFGGKKNQISIFAFSFWEYLSYLFSKGVNLIAIYFSTLNIIPCNQNKIILSYLCWGRQFFFLSRQTEKTSEPMSIFYTFIQMCIYAYRYRCVAIHVCIHVLINIKFDLSVI